MTVQEVALIEITLSIRNGDNLAGQVPSKDLSPMNLWNFAALVSKSDPESFFI